ncbi:MAG: hypothetical protein ACI837_003057 [Crocinitomicaceae bacterium]|jgi:hypothetical protein
MCFALVVTSIMFTSNANAQGSWRDKLTWTFKVQKIDANHAYIVGTAKLINGWHIFSVNHDPMKADFTGYPTAFNFIPSSANYKLVGKLQDGKKAHEHIDDLGVSLYFEGTIAFKQKIEVLTDKSFNIEFGAVFQICDENGCIFPPEEEVKLRISGYSPGGEDVAEADGEKLTIKTDHAVDKDGNLYVEHLNEWVRVPEGNSAKFYKAYLELGGKYEN